MANLNQIPYSNSLSSPRLFFSSPVRSQISHIIHRRCNSIFISAFKKPPPRGSRKVKSNEDLRNDIREFLSSIGLPEYHIPSMKELSSHGRQDLANIVRRRGYKFIRQLLEISIAEKIKTCPTEKLEMLNAPKGQKEKLKLSADGVLLRKAIQEGDFKSVTESDLEFMSDDKTSLASESTTFSLEEKVAKCIQNGVLDAVDDCGFGIIYDRQAGEEEGTIETLNPSSAQNNTENQAEVKHLQSMLHQKELELNQLKEQIEKEKLALSVLQATAETEIIKAQKLISEKEIELHAGEESLSGLKEVEIQYSGEGETVELAGSFNGWHYRIKMDLHSSSFTDPNGSRISRVWRTVLWLYPGVYEIKFVIDDQWRTDPRRESITHNGMSNNILRVNR